MTLASWFSSLRHSRRPTRTGARRNRSCASRRRASLEALEDRFLLSTVSFTSERRGSPTQGQVQCVLPIYWRSHRASGETRLPALTGRPVPANRRFQNPLAFERAVIFGWHRLVSIRAHAHQRRTDCCSVNPSRVEDLRDGDRKFGA